MRTIPEVRVQLKLIADNLKEDGNKVVSNKINRLIKEMYKRPSIRRASKESADYTPALAASIRQYASTHPNASYQTMAKRFNVAVGRVSEAIIGKRAA